MRQEDLLISINFACSRETFRQFPLSFLVAGRNSMNFRQLSVLPEDLLSTFHVALRPSANFRNLFVWLGDLLWTFANFCMARRPSFKFRHLSVQPGDLSFTSVNFLCGHETSRKLPSYLGAVGRPFVNFRQFLCGWNRSGQKRFRQHSLRSGALPPTFVNIPYNPKTFHKLPSTFRVAGRPSSTSVNILCVPVAFCKITSTFHAVGRPSVKFWQVSVQTGDLPSTFHAAGRTSVNWARLGSLIPASERQTCLAISTLTFRAKMKLEWNTCHYIALHPIKCCYWIQAVQKVDGSWRKVCRMQGKLKVSLVATRKVCGSCRKVSRPTGKSSKVNRRSSNCTESWQKLTDGIPTVRKDDESWRNVCTPHGKLTKGLLAAQKVDWRSPGTECRRKLTEYH